MKFKEGVELKKLTPALSWIFECLIDMNNPEIVITSINDGLHSKVPPSRHYTDEAVDVRSHNITDKETFMSTLRNKLNISPLKNNAFTVILEDIDLQNEHFHIQVIKGGTFP